MITDELSEYYSDLLDGSYNCVDRVVLNAHFGLCYSAGGFRCWWRRLHNGSEEELDNAHLMRMAGRFSRRVRGYAKAHGIPVIDCSSEERKHKIAQAHLKNNAPLQGLFLILVGRAMATLWEVERSGRGVIRKAVLSPDLPRELFTSAFRDNFELRYEGIRYDEISSSQHDLLLRLIEVHIGRIRPGHAQMKMEEVKRHLRETYFAWMGGVEEDSVFYYRIHSPVLIIEFDHQRGLAFPSEKPSRNHIHILVRTPNGNDYGKDLLRQHYEQSHHSNRS